MITSAALAITKAALDRQFGAEWADGPRRHASLLARPRPYYVWRGADFVRQPNGAYFMYESMFKLQDCYSVFDEREYFAQVVNAYLGCNGGKDPYTLHPRHNGEAWVRTREHPEMVNLLDALFSAGGRSHLAPSRIDQANVDDGTDEVTVGQWIRTH